MTLELVLLDRDGTINASPVRGRYVTSPDEAVLLPGAAAAIASMNAAGIRVVVVTNQRGLATGELSEGALRAVQERLDEALAAEGAHIDRWYVCPHEDAQCDCRKPLPGLLARALADEAITHPEHCVVIGDAESDMLAGHALGIPGILVAESGGDDGGRRTVATATHPSLEHAVASILSPEV